MVKIYQINPGFSNPRTQEIKNVYQLKPDTTYYLDPLDKQNKDVLTLKIREADFEELEKPKPSKSSGGEALIHSLPISYGPDSARKRLFIKADDSGMILSNEKQEPRIEIHSTQYRGPLFPEAEVKSAPEMSNEEAVKQIKECLIELSERKKPDPLPPLQGALEDLISFPLSEIPLPPQSAHDSNLLRELAEQVKKVADGFNTSEATEAIKSIIKDVHL